MVHLVCCVFCINLVSYVTKTIVIGQKPAFNGFPACFQYCSCVKCLDLQSISWETSDNSTCPRWMLPTIYNLLNIQLCCPRTWLTCKSRICKVNIFFPILAMNIKINMNIKNMLETVCISNRNTFMPYPLAF